MFYDMCGGYAMKSVYTPILKAPTSQTAPNRLDYLNVKDVTSYAQRIQREMKHVNKFLDSEETRLIKLKQERDIIRAQMEKEYEELGIKQIEYERVSFAKKPKVVSHWDKNVSFDDTTAYNTQYRGLQPKNSAGAMGTGMGSRALLMRERNNVIMPGAAYESPSMGARTLDISTGRSRAGISTKTRSGKKKRRSTRKKGLSSQKKTTSQRGMSASASMSSLIGDNARARAHRMHFTPTSKVLPSVKASRTPFHRMLVHQASPQRRYTNSHNKTRTRATHQARGTPSRHSQPRHTQSPPAQLPPMDTMPLPTTHSSSGEGHTYTAAAAAPGPHDAKTLSTVSQVGSGVRAANASQDINDYQNLIDEFTNNQNLPAYHAF